MGFRTGAYAKVWEVKPVSDTLTKLRISISKKNKQSGEYEQDFADFVAAIGTAAAKKAAGLKEGDKIKLGDVDVSNSYNKEKGIKYTNFKLFSFEIDGGTPAPAYDPVPVVDDGELDDSHLPF